MKLVAAILATLTLFLTVHPVLTHQNYVAQKETCTSDNCCSDEEETCKQQDKTQQQDDPNKCCNNGHCNPFEVCACCYYIPTEQPVFCSFNPMTMREKVKPTNDKILSSYIQDFWQPPEIA